MSSLERWVVVLAFVWILTAINLAGVRITGWAAVGLGVLALAPDARVHGRRGARRRSTRRGGRSPRAGTASWSGLGLGLAVMMWNYSGWDTPTHRASARRGGPARRSAARCGWRCR